MNHERGANVLSAPGMDRIVNVLRNRQRRRTLMGLAAGRVSATTDVMMRGTNVEEVESDLEQTHLPMLEEEGYIVWDRESGEISKGPRFDEIEPVLKLLEEHADELPPFWP